MTAEMHQASKAWLQQLHEWGLILKSAIAIEKGETMRREHEQILCWIKDKWPMTAKGKVTMFPILGSYAFPMFLISSQLRAHNHHQNEKVLYDDTFIHTLLLCQPSAPSWLSGARLPKTPYMVSTQFQLVNISTSCHHLAGLKLPIYSTLYQRFDAMPYFHHVEYPFQRILSIYSKKKSNIQVKSLHFVMPIAPLQGNRCRSSTIFPTAKRA